MITLLGLGDFFRNQSHHLWSSVKSYLGFGRQPINSNGGEDRSKWEQRCEAFIRSLLEGRNFGIQIDNSEADPKWLDRKKIKRGQDFAKCNYVSICYSNLISLYLLFSHERSLRALIFTDRSKTVESAYKRYMSTIHRVKSWYEEDITDENSPARKNISVVNNYHTSVASKLNELTEDEFINKSSLSQLGCESANCFQIVKTVMLHNGVKDKLDLLSVDKDGIHVSQLHMAVTQFGFMGLVLLYPAKFGISNTKDMESFIHLWEYIGYLLGMKDDYNLCTGTQQEVVLKCSAILNYVLKPCLSHANPYWEHMSLCACRGIATVLKRLMFEPSLAFLLDILDLDFCCFYSTMTWKARLKYHFLKFTFGYLVPMQWMRERMTERLLKLLEREKMYS